MSGSRRLFAVGLLIALVVAVVLSQFASSSPDGLEFVAEEEGFAESADDHAAADSPLAEYGEGLSDDEGVNTAVAGLIGTLVTLAIGYGLFWMIRRRDHTPHEAG